MILTTGCSFTYGEELDYKLEAYPHVLGLLLREPVRNDGLMGASNDYIKRATINAVLKYNPKRVVVQWSETNRLELHANHPISTPGRYDNYTGVLQTNIRWTGQGVRFIDDYYKNWFDEKLNFDKWLTDVIALQGFLESRDVDYVMINAFGNQELIQKYDSEMYQYINTKRFLGFPDKGFVEWAYGCPLMPKGHPGKEGHRVVAGKLYEYFSRK